MEDFSGYYSTKNSISMSFVREKTSRSSDESQDLKLLSVVKSQKPSDESQESKLLSVVKSQKPSDESQDMKHLSVVKSQKPSDEGQESKYLSVVELPKSSIELPKPYNNNKEFKGFSGTEDQRTGKTTS